jgi:hypothetical protein
MPNHVLRARLLIPSSDKKNLKLQKETVRSIRINLKRRNKKKQIYKQEKKGSNSKLLNLDIEFSDLASALNFATSLLTTLSRPRLVEEVGIKKSLAYLVGY